MAAVRDLWPLYPGLVTGVFFHISKIKRPLIFLSNFAIVWNHNYSPPASLADRERSLLLSPAARGPAFNRESRERDRPRVI